MVEGLISCQEEICSMLLGLLGSYEHWGEGKSKRGLPLSVRC
jgi:hypothetical protein